MSLSYSEMIAELNAREGVTTEQLVGPAGMTARTHAAVAKNPQMKITMELLRQLMPVIRNFVINEVAAATTPLQERIAELEARPMPKWAGPYKESTKYPVMAFAVHQGGLWVAKCETISRPGTDHSWQLCVKRGDHG